MKQIVISVPDEWLEGTQPNLYDVMGAVMEGIVLPEHHGDLKDVDKLMPDMCETTGCGYQAVSCMQIDLAPTIIPATKEKSCKNCEHGFDSEDCYKCDKNIQNTCEPNQTATKEGE